LTIPLRSGSFTKTSGTIYGDNNISHDGSNGSTENTATTGNGHAVYLNGGKKHDTTTDNGDKLYAQYNGSVWTYTDPDPDGLGDTTANWE
jgi:hypothetical protein